MPDVRRKPTKVAARARQTRRAEAPAAVIEGAPVQQAVPDYPLAETVLATTPAQLKALSDPIRRQIIDLVMERAATTTELALALDRPKGTVDHHLKVLERAGVVRVVRTRKVRALTESYWGRTARTIKYDLPPGTSEPASVTFFTEALDEQARVAARRLAAGGDHTDAGADESCGAEYTTLRHARIPLERARELAQRLDDLAIEFTTTERGGDTVFGLLLCLYETDRAVLPPPHADEVTP